MTANDTRAVIWDMDGVIVDTVMYHCRAWQHILEKRGISITEEEYRNFFGQRNDTIIRRKIGERISDDELNNIAVEKEEYYYKLLKGNLKPLPGAMELIKSLPSHGFCSAIASSAPKETIERVLTALDIWRYFEVDVAGREVDEGKPSPQIYLLAAEKLGVKPSDCIVIEDALAGVEGARRAGMKCIAVATTHPREKLAGADLVVSTLDEVSVFDLEKLLNTAKGK
jgi:beta-phosphoglucomutase family hydrolase